MSEPQGFAREIVSDKRNQRDPVAQALMFAIAFVVVTALVGLLYALLGGFIGSSSPRTLAESQIVSLQNASVTNPKSGAARQAYILALEETGQHGAAWREYMSAIKQLTGMEKTQVYAAGVTLLFDKKDYNGAIALAKEAIASDDAFRKAVIADGAKQDAVITNAQFNQTARIAILLTSARASGASKDWNSAVNKLTDALVLDPMGSDLLVFRASAYAHRGQKDKAIADYKTSLKYIPDYAPALKGLKELQGK